MGRSKAPPGTWIEKEMLESKAYLALTGFGPQLLTLILLRRRIEKHGRKGRERRVCVNCDRLNITYTEFKSKYGINQPRLARAFDQLLEKGFISIVHPGGMYRRDKAIYSLSDQWMMWCPGMVFERRKKEVVVRGFCKPKKQKSHTKL